MVSGMRRLSCDFRFIYWYLFVVFELLVYAVVKFIYLIFVLVSEVEL